MADATAAISRDQRAGADFINGVLHLRSRLQLPEDQAAVDALTETALRFGTCELAMRRSDRLRVVGHRDAEAGELAAAAMADHELGLAALAGVRPLADRFTQRETDDQALALWRETSPRLLEEWRGQVAEFDIEAVKAGQLLKLADAGCEALDRAGLAGLGKYLSATLDELERLRRSEDRGTKAESFPYWKIAIAAVLWGISIGVIYDMITRGVPWWQPFLWSVAVAIITFCIGLGC